jgi:hypothetical protein
MRSLRLTSGFQRHAAKWNTVEWDAGYLDEFTNTARQPIHEHHPNGRYGLHACGGDWFMRVGDYLEVNGIDEPLTTLFHFQSVDFEKRWCLAVEKGLVKPGIVSEGNLVYLPERLRESLLKERGIDAVTNKTKTIVRRPCDRCRAQWRELQMNNSMDVKLADVRNNAGMVDLGVYFEKRWFYCRQCDAPMCHVGTPNFATMPYKEEHRATIGLMKKWGRNLKKAREKVLNMPMDRRIKYVADSYADQEVLIP